MSYRIEQSAAAHASVAAQLEWYESTLGEGDDLSLRWFEKLHTALRRLTSNPERHGFAPENGQWMPQLVIRQMVFRPWKSGAGWRVLFTVDEKAQVVTVLQLRHEHRRYLHERGEAETE